MNALRTRILPDNRTRAEYYLEKVSSTIVNLAAGFQTIHLPENLEFKFQPFIDYEEARIRQNLQDIRYDFDALDPVYVVAGPGRIEKVSNPFMFLPADSHGIATVRFTFDLSAPRTRFEDIQGRSAQTPER